MNWNQTMGYVSSFATLLPIAIIAYFQLYKNRNLLVLMFYYIITLVFNMSSEQIINLPPSVIKNIGFFNNILDAPLMLIYLLYFAKSESLRKKIHITILSFLVFEVAVTLFFGITSTTITIILGPGILLVLLFTSRFFVEQVKIVVQQNKPAGKALMATSALFAYGCFFIIYLFWYVFETPNVEDAFLVYFFVATISSILVSIGLVIEKKRFKVLDELKTTRKELSMLYPNEKIIFPKETAGSFDEEEY